MGNDWTALGPEGGYFKSFAWDGLGRAYAGSDDSGGVWGSDDDGRSWFLLTAAFQNMSGWDIVPDPHDRRSVYACDMYARWPILHTGDQGETWEVLGTNLPGKEARRVTTLLVDETDPQRLLVGTGNDEMHWGDGMHLSVDGGRTFSRVAFEGKTVARIVRSGGVLVASVLDYTTGNHPGLHRSTDGGKTWQPVGGFLKGKAASSLDVDSDGAILAGAPSLLGSAWRSPDGGLSWKRMGLLGLVPWRILPAGDSWVAGTIVGGKGVLRRERKGRRWVQSTGLESPAVMGLRVNPATGTVLASTFSNTGILRSEDGGRSFTPASTGLRASYITNMDFGPQPGRLLVTMLGTYEVVPKANVAALLHTRDGGASWSRTGAVAAHGLSVAHSPSGSRFLLGTFRQGLWLSQDDAETFRQVVPETIVAAVHFVSDEIALAAVAEIAGGAIKVHLDRSRDGGETWAPAIEDRHANQFVTADGITWAAGATGLLRSTDAGVTWEVGHAASTAFTCVAVDTGDARHVLAGTEGAELWESIDGGATWATVGPTVEPGSTRGIRRLEVRGDTIHAGFNGAEEGDFDSGFFVSDDRGRGWRRVEAGLVNNHVWAMGRLPGTGELHVGTYAGGVFRLEGSGSKE